MEYDKAFRLKTNTTPEVMALQLELVLLHVFKALDVVHKKKPFSNLGLKFEGKEDKGDVVVSISIDLKDKDKSKKLLEFEAKQNETRV